jgi:mannosyltransferase OCH1-like enzyme
MTTAHELNSGQPLVHMTYFSVDPLKTGIPSNFESVKQFFPDHLVKVWSIAEVRDVMISRHDEELLECFDCLIPLAYKSDLASYYLLNIFGGWYTDLNNFFTASPPDVSECTMYLFKDIHDEPAPWSISTSIFYARAHSPALVKVLELVLENFRHHRIGNTPLCVTGPTVFGSAIAGVGLIPGVNYHTGEFVYQGEQKVFLTREKELLALYKPNGVGHGESGVPGGNNYTELWYSRQVYSCPSSTTRY